MLSARRKSDGHTVTAYFSRKEQGPFSCLVCRDEVILKGGRNTKAHFAHANPIACKFAEGESDEHHACKQEIYEALLRCPNVKDAALERPVGNNRPDVSAYINGVPVAIEVQISSLSLETIQRRTLEYARNGVYVLWLLQWTPKLDAEKYAPKIWEKWIHACYFGRVYYWIEGLSIASYRFEPSFRTIPQKSWYGKDGKKITAAGYSQRSTRFRVPVRDQMLNLVKDFVPKGRFWWEGTGLKVSDAKIFIHRINDPRI